MLSHSSLRNRHRSWAAFYRDNLEVRGSKLNQRRHSARVRVATYRSVGSGRHDPTFLQRSGCRVVEPCGFAQALSGSGMLTWFLGANHGRRQRMRRAACFLSYFCTCRWSHELQNSSKPSPAHAEPLMPFLFWLSAETVEPHLLIDLRLHLQLQLLLCKPSQDSL